MIEYEGKKLYIVKVEYEAYVLAESEKDAKDFVDETISNEEPTVDYIPVKENFPNPLRWGLHACIYHPEQNQRDITLGEAIGA